MRKSVFKLVGVGAALVLVTLAVGGTAQKVITVCPSGCDFTSIQAAIQAAPEGAAIQVKAGTYKESLTITKPLSLVGEGAGKTVIEGGVAVLATKVVFLAGFTVKGQGVQLQDSQTVALTEVAIVEGRGDGLAVVNSGTVTVRASTIRANQGSGVLLALGSKAIISANEIVGNKGDGIAIGASQADVRDNLIAGNGGCGIRADAASQVTGGGNRESSFATIQAAINAFPVPPEQQANMGGAVCGTASRDLFTSSSGSILVTGEAVLIGPGTYRENLTITKSVVLRGAGRDKTIITTQASTPVVLVSGSQIQVTLEGLALTGASSDGLSVRGQAQVTVQNSTVSGNGDDGLDVGDSAQVTLQNSQLSGNGSDGLEVNGSAQVTVQNSQLSGNADDGLDLNSTGVRAWVIGNAFLNNKSYGIEAESTDNIVECRGNRFEGNGDGPTYPSSLADRCR
jgi:parallel beta-helix repeat protein